MKLKILILTSFVGALILGGHLARAATYMMSSGTETARAGERVALKIGVDTEGEKLNLFEMYLHIPKGLEVASFEEAGSVVNLWVRAPKFDASTRMLSLVGGVPGGFLGRGVLLTAQLRAETSGDYVLRADPSSRAYLNDGEGTKVQVHLAPYTIAVTRASENVALYRPMMFVFAAIVIILIIWHIRRTRKYSGTGSLQR